MRPTELTIAEAGAALRAGTLTACALLDHHLARIADVDAKVKAFVFVAREIAGAAARQADADFAAGLDRGPMQGIPFAIKDIIDLAGTPTTCGARRRTGALAATDAEVVALLKAAGAVPLGKVATYEFALTGPAFDGAHPPSRNPWNGAHITGGSSSGSAAAVAARLVRVALGTDTGGSVRSPAAYTGVVGLKPTFGRLPLSGVYPLSPSLDCVGILAACSGDASAVLSALTGEAPAPVRAPFRIGYARDFFAADPSAAPEVIEAVDGAASVLSLLGAEIALIDLPDARMMEDVGSVILHHEAYAVHLDSLRAGKAYGRQAWQGLVAGAALTEADHATALVAAARLRAGVDAALAPYDAILTATTLTPAPAFAAFDGDRPVWTPMRTLPFNVTGHPALSLPAGFAGGLPLGAQLVARHGDEATLLRIGAAFEAATDHLVPRPPL